MSWSQKPRCQPILLAGPFLALSVFLPWEGQWLCALAAIVVLGVPHGALDGEIARHCLRAQVGWLWFPVFSLPYLLLFVGVLIVWHLTPIWSLAAFLAASAWHFGSEDAPSGRLLDILVLGGLPIALPVLIHPSATAFIFAIAAGVPFAQPPDWLWAASLCWLALALVWIGFAIRTNAHLLALPGILACVFIALPPLTAFSIYFVCVHAPAHTAALICNPLRAPRVRDGRSATLLSLPITALTLLIGAALWPLYTGSIATRLLSLIVQVLAALTLPHMLFDFWLTRQERRSPKCETGKK